MEKVIMSAALGFGSALQSKSKSHKVKHAIITWGKSRAGRPRALLGQRGARLVSERRCQPSNHLRIARRLKNHPESFDFQKRDTSTSLPTAMVRLGHGT
jgi:hypothetical protein